ncbi:hypothetical protein [Mycolicibacterium porcinum]|uniref:Hypervirulence associated protein TUDOR domain-containing protein n=1 Tax=Mycolicibacterium porcinum TaxID=39693 RepID=A0ABV3VB37_9MYCO
MKADYYPPRSRVRVIVAGDPYAGQVGTVDQTRNDGTGDMVHRVAFRDGGRADYYADEIAGHNGLAIPAPRQQEL